MEAHIELIESDVSSDWWKSMINAFVVEGDKFEIRCFKKEKSEIKNALQYGKLDMDASTEFELSILGVISPSMLNDILCSTEPKDKLIYAKMTEFFTLNLGDKVHSSHYGTEVHLKHLSEQDVQFLKELMLPVWDKFSIHIY